LWQLKHNRWLDGVLQCGDLGFFPDMTQIDKATRRFYKRDPEEMGFARFFSPFGFRETDALLEQTLCGPSDSLETVTAPVYWCHGSTTHKPRYTDAPPMTITEPPIPGQGGKHQRNAPIQGQGGKH
jgi:hypothetical protein